MDEGSSDEGSSDEGSADEESSDEESADEENADEEDVRADDAGSGASGVGDGEASGEKGPHRPRMRRCKTQLQCSIWIGGQVFSLVPDVSGADELSEKRGRKSARVEQALPQQSLEARQEREKQKLCERLRRARLRAGFTQAELARRLGISAVTVSNAETGRGRFGKRYLRAALDACGVRDGADASLGETAGEAPPGSEHLDEELPYNWAQNLRYCAGIDPHHFTPVRRGSARDLELRETYPRWKDWAQVEVYG